MSNTQQAATASPEAAPGPPRVPAPEDNTVAVCCGCRPRRRKWQTQKSWTTSYTLRQIRRMRSDKYVDAESGNDAEWHDKDNSETDSLFFFDAVASELDPNEYPIVFTTKIPHPAPKVSLDEPETLLRQTTPPTVTISAPAVPPRRQDSAPIESHQRRSTRFENLVRRSTNEFQKDLENPRVKIPLQGYPGDLTIQELAECQKFLRMLKTMDAGVSAQIYSFRDVEEEPYTICRWLRATKFDAAKILKRCEENQPMFEVAQQADFYPNPSQAMGAPYSVFLSQYPFLAIGKAKNNCPVNYFQIGKLHPEGIMALTTCQQLAGYFWWNFMHKMKDEVREAQQRDPDFVRMEGINIMDLEGLSASALSQETLDVIQLASKISDFFPETLHCMLILNAPGFFSMMWGMIKKFIDPRTAARIQVFSNKAKGLAALHHLIEKEEIPVDYGGTNITIKEAFKEAAADPTLLRQEIQLIHVGRKKLTKDKICWNVDANEIMEISIFTRSVSAAKISIQLNGSTIVTIPSAKCTFQEEPPTNENGNATTAHTTKPHSNCIVATSGESNVIQGPGLVTVEVLDLDDATKEFSSCSRGYFLMVGNVKKKQT